MLYNFCKKPKNLFFLLLGLIPLVIILDNPPNKNSFSGRVSRLKAQIRLPVSEVFKLRRRRLHEECAKRGLTGSAAIPADLGKYPDWILVNKEHNILWCSVPKVASTNWRRFFVQQQTGKIYLPFPEEKFHIVKDMLPYLQPLKYQTNETLPQLVEKTKNYTKIIWVRNPLRRVYSAWKDKLATYNPYYWKSAGKYILDHYRSSKTRSETNSIVTLEEFFRFLVDLKAFYDDPHWTTVSSLCLPCAFDYDYIGHLEGGNEEVDYVIEHVLGRTNLSFPEESKSNRSESSAANELLRAIPQAIIEAIYKKYADDFDFFDYPAIPDFL